MGVPLLAAYVTSRDRRQPYINRGPQCTKGKQCPAATANVLLNRSSCAVARHNRKRHQPRRPLDRAAFALRRANPLVVYLIRFDRRLLAHFINELVVHIPLPWHKP